MLHHSIYIVTIVLLLSFFFFCYFTWCVVHFVNHFNIVPWCVHIPNSQLCPSFIIDIQTNKRLYRSYTNFTLYEEYIRIVESSRQNWNWSFWTLELSFYLSLSHTHFWVLHTLSNLINQIDINIYFNNQSRQKVTIYNQVYYPISYLLLLLFVENNFLVIVVEHIWRYISFCCVWERVRERKKRKKVCPDRTL